MANKPLTPPCGSWSAIHSGCSIERGDGPVAPGPDVPVIQLLLGGVVFNRPVDDYPDDNPATPHVDPLPRPSGPAYFPPIPPYGI